MMRIAIASENMLDELREALLEPSGYRIVWIARCGEEAVQRCAEEKPDLLLLDPSLCRMEGVEAVRRIMRETPCPILLVTEALEHNAAKIFDAMGYGALDAVSVPCPKYAAQKALTNLALLKKIRMIKKLTRKSLEDAPPRPSSRAAVSRTSVPFLVVIGSSAGGPKTLAALFSQLPVSFRGTIIVVQHVDNTFSAGFIEWLNAQTALRVRPAVPGELPGPGNVYVAGSNDHLVLTSRLTFSYTSEPRTMPYRPSVDVLFKSVAQYWPTKGKAILLTGMGRDGAEGLALLRKAGWHTIAQDQASSIVYGMPKAAKELGAAVEILSLNEITASLLKSA
jgi:two-component system response regulator WspF